MNVFLFEYLMIQKVIVLYSEVFLERKTRVLFSHGLFIR